MLGGQRRAGKQGWVCQSTQRLAYRDLKIFFFSPFNPYMWQDLNMLLTASSLGLAQHVARRCQSVNEAEHSPAHAALLPCACKGEHEVQESR